MLARRWFFAFFFLAAIGAVADDVHADTYMVISPPKIISLGHGERAVAVNAEASGVFRPDRIYIQLALVGPPVVVTPRPPGGKFLIRPWIEDCPGPLAMFPFKNVTQEQLAQARNLLERLGFAAERITANLRELTYDFCSGHPGEKASVGQILLAVEPPATFETAVKTLHDAMSVIPSLRPAGVVELRETCDAQQRMAALADAEAERRARMLASVMHLQISAKVDGQWSSDYGFDPNTQQLLCGDISQAQLSTNEGRLMTPAPAYKVSLAGGAVFRASDAGGDAAVPNVHFLQRTDVPSYNEGVASFGFQMHADQPFVSARGSFRATVQPQAEQFTFSVWPAAGYPAPVRLLAQVTMALEQAGVPPAAIRSLPMQVSARIEPADQKRVVAIMQTVAALRKGSESQTSFGLDAIVHNCAAIQEAVAREAVLSAYHRATAMAAAAHVRVGSIIAATEAGDDVGALCEDSGVPLTDQVSHPLTDGTAVFASELVVAWQLVDSTAIVLPGPAPQFAPPYEESNLNQVFVPVRNGVVGSFTQPLAPTQAFLSIPVAQDLIMARQSFATGRLFPGSWAGNALVELRFPDPAKVGNVVAGLRASTLKVDNVSFHAANCARNELPMLTKATQNALVLSGGKPVYALIDQGAVYQPQREICGFIGEGGLYTGGTFNVGDVNFTIEERAMVVTE